jgi:putative hydrolase of the HAD superfamily
MSAPHIKVILFDLGRVVIDFDHTRAARKISQLSPKSEEEIYQFFFDSGLTGMFEEGKVSPEEFFAKVREALSLTLSYEQFTAIWNDIFFMTDINRDVLNLAQGLKKQYTIALLSNVNILHFEYLKEKFPLFGVFHHIFTSYEMHMRKPDPEIYRKVLEVVGVPAGGVFYTDDRPDLIQSACALGIRAYVFQGAEQLIRDLTQEGVVCS